MKIKLKKEKKSNFKTNDTFINWQLKKNNYDYTLGETI